MTRYPRRLAVIGAAVAVAALGLFPTAAGATRVATAGNYVTISGSGSSWSEVALDQWSQDVQSQRHRGQLQPGRLGGRARQDYMAKARTTSPPPTRRSATARTSWPAPAAEHPVRLGVLLHPGHRRRHGVHVPPRAWAATRSRTCGCPRKTIMEIFTGADHQLGRPADHQGLRRPAAEPADHAGGPVRRLGRDLLLHPLDVAPVPVAVERVLRQGHPADPLPCGQTEFYPSGFGNVKAENGSNNVMPPTSPRATATAPSATTSTPTRSTRTTRWSRCSTRPATTCCPPPPTWPSR